MDELHSETGIAVTIDRSEEDGTLIIFIDGADGHDAGDGQPGRENDHGPVLRILLNDGPVWANPPYPADHTDPTEEQPITIAGVVAGYIRRQRDGMWLPTSADRTVTGHAQADRQAAAVAALTLGNMAHT